MEIEGIEQHSAEELFDRLRRVSMLKRPDIFPYDQAKIKLKSFRTDELSPPQQYVLRPELDKIWNLYHGLNQAHVDLFHLGGYVTINLSGYEPIDVLPPVIELSVADNPVCNIINDGMHRIYFARIMKWPVQCIFISGVPEEYPYYAFPLEEGWDGVEVLEELPEGYEKKKHRIVDYHSLYRNFNSAFQNVGAPRPVSPSQ